MSMWDSLTSAVSAVSAGIVGTGEKVPFSCQTPFKKFSERMDGAEELAQLFYGEAQALQLSPKWQDQGFADPDGGDMRFLSQPQMGCYHFVKASFTIRKASALDAIGRLTSMRKEVRAEFSKDLAQLTLMAQKGDATLLHIAYAAPGPGAAGRDFVFLAGIKHSADGTRHEAWGCSVDVNSRPEDFEDYVRGACLYHWDITQKGDDVVCIYTGCFDPRGWTPPFIITWFKSSATEEFRALRRLCAGKRVPQQAAAAQ
jgi:hypothetical protein